MTQHPVTPQEAREALVSLEDKPYSARSTLAAFIEQHADPLAQQSAAQQSEGVADDAVERAAEALFRARHHEAFSWDKASGGERDLFRTHARAALSAGKNHG